MKKLIAILACVTIGLFAFATDARSFDGNSSTDATTEATAVQATPAPKATPKPAATGKTTTNTVKQAVLSEKYKDGSFYAYGAGSIHGSEKAEITIKNGKLTSVKLYKLGTNMLLAGEAYSYQKAIAATAPMAQKFLKNGIYFDKFAKADAVSGATSSSTNWNLAVMRAFQKAAKTSSKNTYFDGTFGGADKQSRVLVLVDISKNKVSKVSTCFLNSSNNVITDYSLTPKQKELIEAINSGLMKDGVKLSDIEGAEYYTAAAKAAYTSALANASVK